MKLKEGFLTTTVGKDSILVSVDDEADFHGFARMNETSALIIECLKKDTSFDGIVDAVLAEYEVDRYTVEADVRRIVQQLREMGAIEDG